MATNRQSIKQHHVMGAGAIATIMWAFHFLSQSGFLTGLPPSLTDGLNSAYEENFGGYANSTPAPSGNYPSTQVGYLPSTNAAQTYGNQQYGNQSYGGHQYGNQPYSAQPSSNPYAAPGLNPNASNYPATYGGQRVDHPHANGAPSQTGYHSVASTGDIRVFFSPAGGCTDAIVHEIQQAQQQLYIQAYSFTSKPIAAACLAAHQRGVRIIAILDKSQETEQYSEADFLAHSGILTLIDSKHAIAHNKVMLIDGRTIITGSFNFSSSAEKSNAENLLIIKDRPDLYAPYENNFKHHYEHSVRYLGRGNSAGIGGPSRY